MTVELGRFEEAVGIVRRDFPHLRMDVRLDDKHVDAIADLPTQPGLDFPVSFSLCGDELGLNVSHFWVEWFPCSEQWAFDRFTAALTGVLSGQFRIRESFMFGVAVQAELQRPKDPDTWETVATWGNLLLVLMPLPRKYRIVRNNSRA